MVSGILVVVGIIVIVMVHETGHFLAARAVGMKATEFFFGFGPRLWSTRRGDTEYGVKLLPLGGYVRITGAIEVLGQNIIDPAVELVQVRKQIGMVGLTLLAGGAQAAGFALIEQNASGLGNAYAGQAAVAGDASTIFFNPAGLTELEGRQAVLAGHYIQPSAQFAGASTPATVANGDDAGKPAFVPNAYYAMDVGPGLKFGVGLNAPFGLATEYDFPWAGMTQALLSDVKTINLNPSLAWRVNDRFSVGMGVNWQRIEAELSSYNPMLPAVVTATAVRSEAPT